MCVYIQNFTEYKIHKWVRSQKRKEKYEGRKEQRNKNTDRIIERRKEEKKVVK